MAADLSDPAELEDLAGHAGTVDALVNNAGFSCAWTDMHSVDPQWLVEFEVDAIIPD